LSSGINGPFLMKVWKTIFLSVTFLLWALSTWEVFWAAQGPDISFRLDSNHQLMGWPGFLVQRMTDGTLDLLLLPSSSSQTEHLSGIDKFSVSEQYIVGEAEQGWFAINRESLQAWGPFSSIDELERKVGANFNDLSFIEEIPYSYRIIYPHTWFAMAITSLIFAGIAIVGVWLLPSLYHRFKTRNAPG